MIIKHKMYLVILLVCLLLACLPMQTIIGNQLADMLKLTLTVYALARGLNAVISVAQGTEMSIEPMGIGLTLTPGEILDPLNDLIEQVSTILLMASASLGVQNILLSLGDYIAIRLILAILIVASIVLLASRTISLNYKQGFIKLVIVLTVLRLAVPVVVVVSHQMQQFLQTERQQALATLQTIRDDVDNLNVVNKDEPSSWFDGFKDKLDVEARLAKVKQQADLSVEATVYLLAEFVLVMVLLPLLFFYMMLKLPTKIRL